MQSETGTEPELKSIFINAYLKGEAPLHRAAAYGNVTIIKILLESGAEPSMKDANVDTPISWGS